MARIVSKLFITNQTLPQFNVIICVGDFAYCYRENGGNVFKVSLINPLNFSIIGSLPSGTFGYGTYDEVNNEIFIPPVSSQRFVVINVINDTISTIGSNLGTSQKYSDAMFKDGKIVGFPLSVLDAFVYDCVSKTFTFIPTISGNSKFNTTAYLNGKFYGSPVTNNFIGVIDAELLTFSELTLNIHTAIVSTNNTRIMVAANQHLIIGPAGTISTPNSGIWEYNIINNSVELYTIPEAIQSFNNLIYQRNGRVYSFRNVDSGGYLAEINPTFKTAKRIGGIFNNSLSPIRKMICNDKNIGLYYGDVAGNLFFFTVKFSQI